MNESIYEFYYECWNIRLFKKRTDFSVYVANATSLSRHSNAVHAVNHWHSLLRKVPLVPTHGP